MNDSKAAIKSFMQLSWNTRFHPSVLQHSRWSGSKSPKVHIGKLKANKILYEELFTESVTFCGRMHVSQDYPLSIRKSASRHFTSYRRRVIHGLIPGCGYAHPSQLNLKSCLPQNIHLKGKRTILLVWPQSEPAAQTNLTKPQLQRAPGPPHSPQVAGLQHSPGTSNRQKPLSKSWVLYDRRKWKTHEEMETKK